MAVPTWVGQTAINGSISTYTIASDVTGITTDDIEFAIFESANQAMSMSSGVGWNLAATGTGVGTAADVAATRGQLYWRRYDGTHSDIAMSDPGNHIIGHKVAFRGCTTSGTPYEQLTTTTSSTTEVTSVSGTGLTTQGSDRLYVVFMVTGKPDTLSTANLSGSAITNATSVTERVDNAFTSGNGAGIYVVTGEAASSGSYGAFSGTLATASVYEIFELALIPAGSGAQTVSPGLLSSAGSVYSPSSVNIGFSVGVISQTGATYAPQVNLVAPTPALIDSTGAVYEPTQLSLAFSVPLIDQAASTFQPSMTPPQTVGAMDLIDQTGAVFSPQTNLAFSVGAIDRTGATFDPTVTPGTVTVSPALIDQTAAVYAPQVNMQLTLPLIDQTGAVFDPTITPGAVTVTVGRIESAGFAYQPAVSGGGAPPADDGAVGAEWWWR